MFLACRECSVKLQLKAFSEKMLREDIPAKDIFRSLKTGNRRSVTELPSDGSFTESKFRPLQVDNYMGFNFAPLQG